MFCAPITLLHYFQEYKTGGLFCQLFHWGGGQNNPPILCPCIVITFLARKTCRCILGCIAYIFNRGVDAFQANLLKNALCKKGL